MCFVQDIAFFDGFKVGDLTQRLSGDVRAMIYIGPDHDKGSHGMLSPGPAAPYEIIASVGKQVASNMREAPAPSFSRESRWRTYEKEIKAKSKELEKAEKVSEKANKELDKVRAWRNARCRRWAERTVARILGRGAYIHAHCRVRQWSAGNRADQ